MAKRNREFSAGMEVFPAVTMDGFKTEVRHNLKYGIGSNFWYCIKLKCGGFVMFDIRSLVDAVPREFVLTEKSLPWVADIVAKHDYEKFTIRGIGWSM